MAKRFLDTGFFKSPYVRSLEAPLKLLYSFIICDCSAAGIWCVDFDVAGLYCGLQIDKDKVSESFIKTGKIIDLGNGKWFVPGFIEHQYPNGLSEKNLAHKSTISELKKFGLINDDLTIKSVQKEVHQRGTGGALKAPKEKAMVMEEETVTVTVEETVVLEKSEKPFEKKEKTPEQGKTPASLAMIQNIFREFSEFEFPDLEAEKFHRKTNWKTVENIQDYTLGAIKSILQELGHSDHEKSINARMKSEFLDAHFRMKGTVFVWEKKDTQAIMELIIKIKKKTENAKTDDDVFTFWKQLIENIPDWYFKKFFSPTGIDSKFNEIVSEIRQPHATANATNAKIQADLDRIIKSRANSTV